MSASPPIPDVSLAGDTLSVCPPLIITAQELDEMFDRLGRAHDRTLDWAGGEKLLGGASR
jgi:4-aminobutyrate--pyruvate transaminase